MFWWIDRMVGRSCVFQGLVATLWWQPKQVRLSDCLFRKFIHEKSTAIFRGRLEDPPVVLIDL
jgi:hypothetical protein